MFGRLEQELEARDKAAGLSMTDILDLPDSLRALVNWMLRKDVVSMQEAMAQTGQDEPTTRSTLRTLVDKGFVREMQVRGETHYKVRIKSHARRPLPSNVWRALDDKLGKQL
jgi:predicted transcriptional regulator